MFALGLNIVVGFAGLLDLGYVAFFALGSYAFGWLGSGWFYKAHVHVLVHGTTSTLPGIHLNFLLILICAGLFTAFAGAIIGVPTLRLRGDYIAIVTLAFGEIIRVFALQGPSLKIFGMPLTGGELGISGTDPPYLPGVGIFSQLDIRPWYYTIFALVLITLFVTIRVRDSRLGRAWIALREDEVAAVSMGIPLVRTKLFAYALGAAFGGIAGAFLGAYTTLIDAGEFQFGFSIFVLSMVILGGLGSVWGAVVGAMLLANINYYLIPDVLNSVPGKLGLNFNLTDLQVEHLRLPARSGHGAAPARADSRSGGENSSSPRGSASPSWESQERAGPAWSPERWHHDRRLASAHAGPRVADSQRRGPIQGVRRPGGRQPGLGRRPGGVDSLDHRSQRRREDDVLQHAHRSLQVDQRADRVLRSGHHPRSTRRHYAAWGRPHVPEHPAVRRDDRARECDRGASLQNARGVVRVDRARAVGACRGASGAREGG